MEKTQLLDVAKLKAATTGPKEDGDQTEVTIAAGIEGTIVHEFHRPDGAFLVEFSDDDGEAVAMFARRAEAFEVVWRSGATAPERVGT